MLAMVRCRLLITLTSSKAPCFTRCCAVPTLLNPQAGALTVCRVSGPGALAPKRVTAATAAITKPTRMPPAHHKDTEIKAGNDDEVVTNKNDLHSHWASRTHDRGNLLRCCALMLNYGLSTTENASFTAPSLPCHTASANCPCPKGVG